MSFYAYSAQQAADHLKTFKKLDSEPDNDSNNLGKLRSINTAVSLYKEALVGVRLTGDDSAVRTVIRNLIVAYSYEVKIEIFSEECRLQAFMEAAEAYTQAVELGAEDHKWLSSSPWRRGLWDIFSEMIEELFMFVPDMELEHEELVRLGHTFASKFNRWSEELEMKNAMVLSRIRQGEGMMIRVMEAVSDRKFQEALYLLAEMYHVVEEALYHLPKANLDENIHADLRTLQEDVRVQKLMSEALKALQEGDIILEEATVGHETLNLDLVFDAVDKYRSAASLVEGEDVEIICISFTNIARVYLKVFKDGVHKTRAKEYLKEVLDLSGTLERNMYTFTWFTDASQMLQDLQDEVRKVEEEKWNNHRKIYLEQLKVELKKNGEKNSATHIDYIKFVLAEFPPKHRPETEWTKYKTGVKDPVCGDSMTEMKKTMMKLVTIYHPDRVQADVHGEKYLVLCEELTKSLTYRYNCLKG